MESYEVLRRPIITEKNIALQSQSKYAFEVADRANKRQVKEAVERAFKVDVVSVNVITVHGKTKRMGRHQVKSSPWKKALVTLEAGQKIEFFEGV
jgi:large subunit ribosomal protein L23